MISQPPGGGNGLGRIAGEALPPDEVPQLDALLPIDNGEDRQVGKVTHDTLPYRYIPNGRGRDGAPHLRENPADFKRQPPLPATIPNME